MKPEDLSITMFGAAAPMNQPRLRRAIVIRADLGTAVQFTTTQGAVRAMFPITGGEARGAGWSARILPGGADFAFALPDGSYAIEAHYCLELTDRTPVMVTNAGKMVPQPDGSFIGRTRAALEVPDGSHLALGDPVYFGTAVAEPGDNDHVYIELWEAPISPRALRGSNHLVRVFHVQPFDGKSRPSISLQTSHRSCGVLPSAIWFPRCKL